jgi:hypothetical protein
MNCIPSRRHFVVLSTFLAACGAPASEPAPDRYGLAYLVAVHPSEQSVNVTLTLSQGDDLLREMRFDADPDRYDQFEYSGEMSIVDGRAVWSPPEEGGSISWRASVPSERNGNGYDAWLDGNWGLFRAEDIIPRAATRTLVGASGQTSIEFDLPPDWSAITEYASSDGRFRVTNAERRFTQPSGWIVVGRLGVRRERIQGTRVAIAAPQGQNVRRLDMIALLNWTLPELAQILPEMPPRLSIVSAGSPMWRGGLSGPQSIYIHADRPLISENGTSTLLHEVVHVALGAHAEGEYDWIVEGIAEFYSLELLRRSGSLTPKRFEQAMERQTEWSKSAVALCNSVSSGATTALAVTVLAALDAEIRQQSDDKASMDDVLAALLTASSPISLDSLLEASTKIMGEKPDALHIDNLPGCRTMSGSEPTSK